MQLEDTRELVGKTATDHRAELGLYAAAASSAVFELLNAYPDVELATLQFRVDSDAPPNITITAMGRRGLLVPPDCSTCHAHHGQPHTEYCHAGGIVGADPRQFPTSIPVIRMDGVPEPPVDGWVDDGCRCPSPNNHLDGCPAKVQVCQGCGCTDDDGCAPITCYWVEPNLCSNCQL